VKVKADIRKSESLIGNRISGVSYPKGQVYIDFGKLVIEGSKCSSLNSGDDGRPKSISGFGWQFTNPD
jgi:hypothetical protein